MSDAPGALPADARARLAMALVLAFGFAAVGQAATVPVILALAAGFVVVLPLVAGPTVLWQAGPLRLRAEGLEAGVLIAGRMLAIVTVTLALLAAVPPHRLAGALRGLGVPALVADLMLLTLRYLDEVRAEMLRARLAHRLRGGTQRWRDLPGHGVMLAAALIRGQRRGEAVWAAMRLRGHGAALTPPPPPLAGRDWAGIALAAGLAGLALALDRIA